MLSLREIGRRCKAYRIEQGYLQRDVARDTGYSSENVSSFENGRNDNSRILLWYFAHGMQVSDLYMRGVNNGKDI